MPSKSPIRVYISGVHSGPNPLPGIGVARSLKSVDSNILVIAVDYSPESTGLYWEGFDSKVVLPPWAERSQEEHIEYVDAVTNDEGVYWISCLDLEVEALRFAKNKGKVLSPTASSALSLARKPPTAAAKILEFSRPNIFQLPAPHEEIHEFLAENSWQCWLKPQNYGAFPVRSWQEFISSKSVADAIWGDAGHFLEQHITGDFASFALCSFEGSLVSAVQMTKTDITSEGKTWSGRIELVPTDIYALIEEFCRITNWTGGAELECIREPGGRIFLMEINPRFPAWIYGATLCGSNLPGALLEKVIGTPLSGLLNRKPNGEFGRIVSEVKKSEILPSSANIDKLHPSGMPSLTKRRLAAKSLQRDYNDSNSSAASTPICNYESPIDSRRATPYFNLNEDLVRKNISACNAWAKSLPPSLPNIQFAYSCKTNPSKNLLRIARQFNWQIDAISQIEMSHCIASGFEPQKIILNGPGKFWPNAISLENPSDSVFLINFDSIPEAERYIDTKKSAILAQRLAMRVRPAGFNSRFGTKVPQGKDNSFYRTLQRLGEIAPIGLHLHLSPSVIGANWWDIAGRIADYIFWFNSSMPCRPITFVDLGGGWTATGWQRLLSHENIAAFDLLTKLKIAGTDDIFFEPGKCILQDAGTLICTVLDIRYSGNTIEIVIDGTLSMIPDWGSHFHAIEFADAHRSTIACNDTVKGVIYGRTCMESDIVAVNIDIPRQLQVSDYVLIKNCGAYDFSMAIQFGVGNSIGDGGDITDSGQWLS
jgi:diaminopimelate decarboxylase